MALAINYAPPQYSSLHGDLIFTVYESVKAIDPVTYPNYKYVCDVYIGGQLIYRAKAFPNPVNKRGVFNLASIIRNYVATQFNPSGSGVLVQEFGAGQFYLDIQCKFGEEYAFTTYLNVLVDTTRRLYNHYNNQLYSDTPLLSAYTNNIASNRPYKNSLLYTCSNFFVPYFSLTGTINIDVNTYDPAVFDTGEGHLLTTDSKTVLSTLGSQITPSRQMNLTGTTQHVNTGSHSCAVTAGSLQQLNLSPSAINNDMAGTITSTTEWYEVIINSTLMLRFDITDERIYKPYTIHFLNQLGGFDSIDFRKLSRKTYDLEKKTYVQQPFRIDGSGLLSYANAGGVVNDTITTYSSQLKQKMKLSTDLLTDVEWQWLKELVFSPLVYLQDGNYKVPVNITATDYEEKKFVNDRLNSLQIDIEFGVQLNAQYR
jgi:hypothetical protein